MDRMDIPTVEDSKIIRAEDLGRASDSRKKEYKHRHRSILRDILVRGKESIDSEITMAVVEMVENDKRHAVVTVADYGRIRRDYKLRYSWRDIIKKRKEGKKRFTKVGMLEEECLSGKYDTIGEVLTRYAVSKLETLGYHTITFEMPAFGIYKCWLYAEYKGEKACRKEISILLGLIVLSILIGLAVCTKIIAYLLLAFLV